MLIVSLLLEAIALILILIAFALQYIKLENYKEENIVLYSENKDLRFEAEEVKLDQRNAEARATDYARKIKTVEDILKQGKTNKENFCTTIERLEKELFTDCNQTK